MDLTPQYLIRKAVVAGWVVVAAGLFSVAGPLDLAVAAEIVVLEPSADNTMYEEDGSLSNGAGIYLFMGVTGDGFSRRALLLFDVAGSVPANATILSAILSFQVNKEPGGAPNGDVSLYRSMAPWGEAGSDAPGPEGTGTAAEPGDATWTHRTYNTVNWVTAGGELLFPVTDTESIVGLGAYEFSGSNLVFDVQDMLDVPATNFGWIIVGDEGQGAFTARRFASRENPTARDRPKLTIEYEPMVPADEASMGRIKSLYDK